MWNAVDILHILIFISSKNVKKIKKIWQNIKINTENLYRSRFKKNGCMFWEQWWFNFKIFFSEKRLNFELDFLNIYFDNFDCKVNPPRSTLRKYLISKVCVHADSK